jgi:hypothetical protein
VDVSFDRVDIIEGESLKVTMTPPSDPSTKLSLYVVPVDSQPPFVMAVPDIETEGREGFCGSNFIG